MSPNGVTMSSRPLWFTAAIMVTLVVAVSGPGIPAAAGAAAPAAPAAAAGAAGAGTWGNAEEVPGTAARNKGADAQINSVSCASPGDCSAGGNYANIPGNGNALQAFVVSETHGTWGKALEVPGLAALNVGDRALVSSVSCASPGDCSAVGYYADELNQQQAFVVTQTNGVWGDAAEVPGTAALNTGDNATVNSVSCASPGNCAMGGSYTGLRFSQQAFVATETNGQWGAAEEVPGTAALNTVGQGAVSSVSCTAAGDCSAGGSYNDGGTQVFVDSETNGTWGTAEQVPGTAALNTANDAGLSSVSCASPGNCSAGGSYENGVTNGRNPHSEAFVVDQTNGTWGTAEEVPGTRAINRGHDAALDSVSCPTAGNCSAGGAYHGNYSNSLTGRPFVVDEVNGVWGHAEEVPGMAAFNKYNNATIASVSCPSAGNCGAGGFYPAIGVNTQPFVVDEVKGRWTSAEAVPGIAALNTGGFGSVDQVSCAAPGNCGAGGYYAVPSSTSFVASEAFVVTEKKTA